MLIACGGGVGREAVLGGLALLVLALGAFAGIDVPLQRKLHADRLKMSHQEAKQEHKESEGNQEVKGKQKAKMRGSRAAACWQPSPRPTWW